MQTIKNTKYRTAQGSAPDYAVVNDYKRIAAMYRAICNVVNMSSQIIAHSTFRYKCAELYILDGDFLATYMAMEHRRYAFVSQLPLHGQPLDIINRALHQPFIHAVDKSVERNFGSVWDKREDRIVNISTDGFQHRFDEHPPEHFTLAVNIAVRASRKIYPLKATCRVFPGRKDSVNTRSSVAVNYQRTAWHKLLHFIRLQIKGGLDDGTFACHDHYLIVDIIKCRTYAIGITHSPHVAVAYNTANDISAIPHWRTTLQHISHIQFPGYSI